MARNEKLFRRLDELEADFALHLVIALRESDRASTVLLTPEAATQYGLHESYADANRPFAAHAEDIIALRRKLDWRVEDCLAARFLAACMQAHNLSDHHRGSAENIAQVLLDNASSAVPKGA